MMVAVGISKLQSEFKRFLSHRRHERLVLIKRHYAPRVLSILTRPWLLLLALGLRAVLLILKPLVHIRFCRLNSYSMGPFAMCTEMYLCQRDAGIPPKRSVDIFYHYDYEHFNRALERPVKPKDAVCNKQLDIMFRRNLRLWEPARRLDQLNRKITRGSEDFSFSGPQPYDQYGFLSRFPAHLTFTEEEEERGRAGLREMGVERDAPFVCFYSRDGAYLPRARPRMVSVFGHWGTGEDRNASIDNYLHAAEELTSLGYYAVRMGKYVASPIKAPNSRVIDYATQCHSEFMDVYLSAKCEFFLGNNAGLINLPMIFRRPIVCANTHALFAIMEFSYQPSVLIPKLFYCAKRGRHLTFREMLDLGLGQGNFPALREISNRLGLELLENTPEEIYQAAMEMQQRLHSTFQPSAEDEELQRRFLSILRSYPEVIRLEPGRDEYVKIGTDFLRRHADLLE